VATKEIERDIGEIKGVLDGIRVEIDNLRSDQSGIFDRINALEKPVIVSQEQISNINKRIDKICEEKEKEKEDERFAKEVERSATNTKLTIVGIILAAIEMVIGFAFAILHV
jgi:tetrahydromethanopterin S-methyltransferase subunit G